MKNLGWLVAVAAVVLFLGLMLYPQPNSEFRDLNVGFPPTPLVFTSTNTQAIGAASVAVQKSTELAGGKPVQTITLSSDKPTKVKLLYVVPKEEYPSATAFKANNPDFKEALVLDEDPLILQEVTLEPGVPFEQGFAAENPSAVLPLVLDGSIPNGQASELGAALVGSGADALASAATQPSGAQEKQAFDQLNQFRQEKGLLPLEWDERIHGLVVFRSQSLAKLGFLAHTQPQCAEALKGKFEITEEGTFAENLALVTSSDGAALQSLEAWKGHSVEINSFGMEISLHHRATLFYDYPDEKKLAAIGCSGNICAFLALTTAPFVCADSAPSEETPKDEPQNAPGLNFPDEIADRINGNLNQPIPALLSTLLGEFLPTPSVSAAATSGSTVNPFAGSSGISQEGSGKNVFRPESLPEAVSLVKKYRPKLVVLAGKHEPAEPSARILRTVVDGKPLSEHFDPSEVLFIVWPYSETPAGVYAAYFDYVNSKIRANADYASLKRGLEALFSDARFGKAAASLVKRQPDEFASSFGSEHFLPSYFKEKNIENADSVLKLLREIDKNYQFPAETEMADAEKWTSQGALPVFLHADWSDTIDKPAVLMASRNILEEYDIASSDYVVLPELAPEDRASARDSFPKASFLIVEEPAYDGPALPLGSKEILGAVVRLVATGKTSASQGTIAFHYLHQAEKVEQTVQARAPRLLAFLEKLLSEVTEKHFTDWPVDFDGGMLSKNLAAASLFITPNNPGVKITSLAAGSVFCVKDGKNVDASEYFRYNLREATADYPDCRFFNNLQQEKKLQPGYFEFNIEKTKDVPFEKCKIVFDLNAHLLASKYHPQKEVRMELPVTIYAADYVASNEFFGNLEDALGVLKSSAQIPAVVVTYGKHEPGEPSARLFETKVSGKKIFGQFGNDVLFVGISPDETPRGYYSAFYRRAKAVYERGDFSLSLAKKLGPFFSDPEKAADDLNVLDDDETMELYEKTGLPLPMSESEFSFKLARLYAGCPEPFHVSVHYGGETSKIYAFNQLIAAHKNLFTGIKEKSGFEAVQSSEYMELPNLVDALKKEETESQKLRILTVSQEENELKNPLLAKRLLEDYETRSARVSSQDERGVRTFTLELGRPQNFAPLSDESSRGLALRKLLFREYPKFDHIFAIGGSYLKKPAVGIDALIKSQQPKVAALLEEVQSYAAKTH
ncbi:hypothetical protein HZC09_04210 [Candidatus Micrarchaeota archaeon]|nr:hypothetical protein [Candidatus Micrarchaeota archaeon]